MNPTPKQQSQYDRPSRALRSGASRRLIDGYPAGYLAELARPLGARARGAAGAGRALGPPGYVLRPRPQGAE
jgi:hypothetical protein